MEQQELTVFTEKAVSIEEATKGLETDEPFFREKFKELLFFIDDIYLLDDYAEKIVKCSLALSGAIKSEFKKSEKKWIDKFLVCRDWQFDSQPDTTEDAVVFESLEDGIEGILDEYWHYKFLAKHKLIETRKYLLNLRLKRVIVDEGKIIEID